METSSIPPNSLQTGKASSSTTRSNSKPPNMGYLLSIAKKRVLIINCFTGKLGWTKQMPSKWDDPSVVFRVSNYSLLNDHLERIKKACDKTGYTVTITANGKDDMFVRFDSNE